MATKSYSKNMEDFYSQTAAGKKMTDESKATINAIKTAPIRALKTVGRKLKQWTSDGWMLLKK